MLDCTDRTGPMGGNVSFDAAVPVIIVRPESVLGPISSVAGNVGAVPLHFLRLWFDAAGQRSPGVATMVSPVPSATARGVRL